MFCLESSAFSREKLLLTLEEMEEHGGTLSYPVFHGDVNGL